MENGKWSKAQVGYKVQYQSNITSLPPKMQTNKKSYLSHIFGKLQWQNVEVNFNTCFSEKVWRDGRTH